MEGKGGRVAVRARVVIDASADADVCRRAGVPVVTDQAPDPNWPMIRKNRLDSTYVPWNDTAIYFVVGGVDFARFRAFAEGEATLSEEDEQWLREVRQFPIKTQEFEAPMVPLFRRAWQDGSFRLCKTVDEHVHLTTRTSGRARSTASWPAAASTWPALSAATTCGSTPGWKRR